MTGRQVPELPIRPYIPPSACAALGAAGTDAILLEGAWRTYCASGMAAVPVGALAIALCLGAAASFTGFLLHSMRREFGTRRALWLAGGILLAALSSTITVAAWQGRTGAFFTAPVSAYRFVVRGDPSLNEFGASMTVDAYGHQDRWIGRVRMTNGLPYEAGAVIEAVGQAEKFDDSDWARGRFMKGEVGSVKLSKVLEVEAGASDPVGLLRAAALTAIDPARSDARALIAGIVCGRTTELNRIDASGDFSRTGLTHLVAVSGSHLAFIGAMLQVVLHRLQMSPTMRTIVLVAVMFAYVLFSGCAPSAIRSVMMVGFGMMAALGKRRNHPLSGLSLTVGVLAVLNPGVVFDMGFQLSAMSVLFILVFGRYVAYLLQRIGLSPGMAEPLSLTLVAQWATLPLTIPVFGQLSLIAPLANLLVGPVMSALLVVGLITVPLSVVFPVVGFLMEVSAWIANASIFLAAALARVPMASLPMACGFAPLSLLYVAAAALFVLWRDWKRWQLVLGIALCIAGLGAHLLRWGLFAPASVTVLDVGQADSILVRDGSDTLLVDAGVDETVVDALARNNVYRVDTLVVTHWDRDHWGGLPDILDVIDIGNIVVAKGAAAAMPGELDAELGERIVELAPGDVLRVGGFSCRVVWPWKPVTGEENGESLCLDIRYREDGKELSVLLTGDTEKEELACYAERVGDVDVLKVGHHGSKVSVDKDVLQPIDPELAVASAGEGNSYGHPSDACIDALEAHGTEFLCTIDSGDVALYPGAQGFRVHTAR